MLASLKISQAVRVLEEPQTQHLSTVNTTENIQKAITFGKEMSNELIKVVFVAVNLQQGVPNKKR